MRVEVAIGRSDRGLTDTRNWADFAFRLGCLTELSNQKDTCSDHSQGTSTGQNVLISGLLDHGNCRILDGLAQVQMRTKTRNIVIGRLLRGSDKRNDGLDACGHSLAIDACQLGDFLEGATNPLLATGKKDTGSDYAIVGFTFGMIFVEYALVQLLGPVRHDPWQLYPQ